MTECLDENFLTDRLVVVILKIGHCGHRTSLHFYVWGYMKRTAYERKVNRTDELHAARRMTGPDVLRKVQAILNLKYP
jgi:hypothetical protein